MKMKMNDYFNEIINVLTFLRHDNCEISILEKRVDYLKKKINIEDFYKVIKGTDEKQLGSFKYKIININNSQYWCLISQIEYEINVKKNERCKSIYQKLKSVNI